MPKSQLTLDQYKEDVIDLMKSAKVNFRNSQQIFSECFNLLNTENKSKLKKKKASKINKLVRKVFTLFIISFTLAIFIYILLNFHQPTSSLVLRNIQGFIYPGLKFLRILSVPVISKFPHLTGLYDESCLVENPYFYVNEMECWPCSNVFSVIEITDTQNQSTYMSGIPHISKSSHEPVTFELLKNLYVQNKDFFHKELSSIKSSSDNIQDLEGLFSHNSEEISLTDLHVTWRINKMSLARIIRSIFPRPKSLPERSGQSVERFIMIDGAKAPPYLFPSMECSYIAIEQAEGQRTIVFRPSPECSQECRTFSLVLNSSTILWYNWWYWRPISLPVENSTDVSIAYISSYC